MGFYVLSAVLALALALAQMAFVNLLARLQPINMMHFNSFSFSFSLFSLTLFSIIPYSLTPAQGHAAASIAIVTGSLTETANATPRP